MTEEETEEGDERRRRTGVHRTFIQLTDSSRVTGGQEIVLIPIHTPTRAHPSAFLGGGTRADTRGSSISYIYT